MVAKIGKNVYFRKQKYDYCIKMLSKKRLLIFDLGGVLIDLHVERSFAAFVAMGADPALLDEQQCLMNDMMQQYDRGEIDTAAFFGYIARFLPAHVRKLPDDILWQKISAAWNMMLGDYAPEKLRRIKELRADGHRVVLLSNTNEGHWDMIEEKFRNASGEELDTYFDSLYLSYKMKCRKPEPEIFLELLRCEGVEPSSCLFFDDSSDNCNVARSVGIEACLVERNAMWSGFFMND